MLNVNNLIGFGANNKFPTLFTKVYLNTGSASFQLPEGTMAGDVVVLANVALNLSGFPTYVLPSGFTNVINITSGLSGTAPRRHTVSYKLVTQSDIGATFTGMNGTNNEQQIMLVFRGYFNAVSHSGAVSSSTDGNPSPQVVTAPTNDKYNIFIGYFRGPDPNIFTVTPTEQISTADLDDNRVLVATIYLQNPQNTTIDAADNGTGNVQAGFYLTLN